MRAAPPGSEGLARHCRARPELGPASPRRAPATWALPAIRVGASSRIGARTGSPGALRSRVRTVLVQAGPRGQQFRLAVGPPPDTASAVRRPACVCLSGKPRPVSVTAPDRHRQRQRQPGVEPEESRRRRPSRGRIPALDGVIRRRRSPAPRRPVRAAFWATGGP